MLIKTQKSFLNKKLKTTIFKTRIILLFGIFTLTLFYQ